MVFEGLVKVTAIPAIFISSAWIIVSKSLIDGIIFLIVAFVIYLILSVLFHEMELERIKKEKEQY
jgi:uncharacterized ion transporter superfamily protein YfcC